jgi:hypothetical protein
MAWASAVAVAAAALAGCGGGGSAGGSAGGIVLDGRTRTSDDAGVVTAVDFDHVVLDGARSYGVDRRALKVFTSNTLTLAPLLGTQGRYVLVGLSHGAVSWIEELTGVVSLPGQPKAVLLFGRLVNIDGHHRAVFADGTVLPLAAGVAGPPPGAMVEAVIDPDTHVVRALRAG